MKAIAAFGNIVSLFIIPLLLPDLTAACGYTGEEGVIFSYSGATGPDKWGTLSPQFRACSNGKHQSPINIVRKQAIWNSNLRPLEIDYTPTNATLVNNVYNIMIQYNQSVGTMVVNEKKYHLKQMHWHSPAEHTIDGVRHPVELHLVHYSDDGNITVISVLYKYGDEDKLLHKIKDKVAELAKGTCSITGEKATHIPLGVINPKYLKHGNHKYYQYVGSLTTPPCTENVIWNIAYKVREMSEEQATALRGPLDIKYKHNSRPLQPLNGRTVEFFSQKRG
ncbi:alpha carbonic anhydrase 1, chloroplastic-like [Dioscorea cayenensis subsp. rotundata]|uniref:Alpha carbonic anhydrase 1, chloroplastic-like n=1 Tax=Dioscorea cayennensis subsp. rotundata TaxID=55577 RepID=A0AB40BG20_DIOCR|nr:alpha carbonic anhydrase 1, chloroplastic-like [Dioscorea cayenensis subsp. rotundata]